ncbi:MAG: hypothetical protein AAGJ17_00145 [Pseudomonadota bacterium]
MPAPMIAAAGIAAAGTMIAAKKGSDAQKRAARSQAESAANAEAGMQRRYDETNQFLAPFRNMGAGNIGALNQLVNQDFNREKTLSDYYKSGEYAMMNDQAMRNVNAMNEASGNVGSSAGGNALAAIAPQLGQNYLGSMLAQRQDKFNMLNSLVGMGQNAAAMQGNNAMQLGSQSAAIQQNLGNNLAASQMAQGQNQANMIGNLAGIASNAMMNYKSPQTQQNQGSINESGGFWGGNQGGMF